LYLCINYLQVGVNRKEKLINLRYYSVLIWILNFHETCLCQASSCSKVCTCDVNWQRRKRKLYRNDEVPFKFANRI